MKVVCAYTTQVAPGKSVPPGTEIDLKQDEALAGIAAGRYYEPGDNPFVQPTMANTEEPPPSQEELDALMQKIDDASKAAADAEDDAEKRIAAAKKAVEEAEAAAKKRIADADKAGKGGK